MFLEHFGLREYPFGITPNTDFFFPYTQAQEALNTVLMALAMGEGFVKITGEVGTGKSMLCRKMLASLGHNYHVALILNPYRDPQSLFLELCSELGADYPAGAHENQYLVLQALARRVMALNTAGKRVLICLDEAQAMPTGTLEALRLLTNLETERRKLVQIVIFGQPELDERLNHPSIRQLKQRITFSYRLEPLRPIQLQGYLQYRLRIAGHPDGKVFSPLAVRALRRRSSLVPRLVNILAHKALLSAYGRGKPRVGRKDVIAAAKDTFEEPEVARTEWKESVAAVILGLALSLAGMYAVFHFGILKL
jgi:MSHA biogenesis protein MshM